MNAILNRVCRLSLLVMLSGCSGLKPYPSTVDANLQIRTKLAGSLLTGVGASLHIYRMMGGCATRYLGSVKLKNGLNQVGIAPGQPTFLVFSFNTSARLGGGTSTIDSTTVFTPRAGGRYTAYVHYADRIYNVSMQEMGPDDTPGREIERGERDCP